MRAAVTTRQQGEAVPNEILNSVGGGTAGATIVAILVWLKARFEKEDRKAEMRAIAREEMNPELWKDRHVESMKKLDALTDLVQNKMPEAVQNAALSGVQAGYRMIIKRRGGGAE